MDRRSFFRTMIGGVAASAAVRTFPFRVFNFPQNAVIAKSNLVSVRFVRTWDLFHDRMLTRFDAVYGFGGFRQLTLPSHIEFGKVLNATERPLSAEALKDFLSSVDQRVPKPLIPLIAEENMHMAWDAPIYAAPSGS